MTRSISRRQAGNHTAVGRPTDTDLLCHGTPDGLALAKSASMRLQYGPKSEHETVSYLL